MSTQQEETPDLDPEGYHTIMAYIKKVDERIEALETKLTELEETCRKCSQERTTPKEEIAGYCTECKHPLTNTELNEPVCPYCKKSSKYTPSQSSEK